ncbi:MAG: DUF222 domain-containing protein, partial [Gordonia sp. (in: high G+C Gram-positive bacteria)]
RRPSGRRPHRTPRHRTGWRRRADALGQIIRTYLSGSQRPTSGGVLPHVTLIRPATPALAVEGSIEGASVPMLGFTGPISTATADLIACDAVHTDVLVDEHDAPLDVGRSQRLFPTKIRRALTVRDGGCAFPGCGRPASWCDAHHPWYYAPVDPAHPNRPREPIRSHGRRTSHQPARSRMSKPGPAVSTRCTSPT